MAERRSPRRGARAAAAAALARKSGRTRAGRPAPPELLGLPKASVFAVPANGDILYRLVRHDKPPEYSFRSRAARGRGKLPDGDAVLHAGVSMFATAKQALARGGKYDSWVAEVKLPEDLSIHLAKTLGGGHYSVWGDPRVLVEHATESGLSTYDG